MWLASYKVGDNDNQIMDKMVFFYKMDKIAIVIRCLQHSV